MIVLKTLELKNFYVYPKNLTFHDSPWQKLISNLVNPFKIVFQHQLNIYVLEIFLINPSMAVFGAIQGLSIWQKINQYIDRSKDVFI